MVFTRLRTRDAAEMALYLKDAPTFFAGHPIKFLSSFGPFEVAEGPGVEGVAILEFPTMADAKAWYNGPVYTKARKQRFLGSDNSVIFVEGVASK
jgi:uncharacterized protein (DUF1330 family)